MSLPNGLFPSGPSDFPTKIKYVIFLSPIRAACAAVILFRSFKVSKTSKYIFFMFIGPYIVVTVEE